MIDGDLSDIVLSREQNGGVPLGRLALGMVVRVSHVARNAFAFEGTFFVGAQLRAAARNCTFVDIYTYKNTKYSYLIESIWKTIWK